MSRQELIHAPTPVSVIQSEDSIEIHLPSSDRDETATVVELTVDGKAFDIDPAETADPTIWSHGSSNGRELESIVSSPFFDGVH